MHTRSTKMLSPARITQLVATWRTSGEANAPFARRHGIHPRTFWGWCRTTPPGETPALRRDPGPAFLPVTVARDAGERDAPVEVVFPSGERLVVRPGATSDVVRAVVTALRPSC